MENYGPMITTDKEFFADFYKLKTSERLKIYSKLFKDMNDIN